MNRNHPPPTRECASVAALLPLAAYGLLSEQALTRLQTHLATCAHCQAHVALDKQIEAELRRSRQPPQGARPLWSSEEISALFSAGDAQAVPAFGSSHKTSPAPPVIPGPSGQSARRIGGLAALAVTLVVVLLASAIFGIPGLFSRLHRSATPSGPAPLSIYVSTGDSQPHPNTVFALDASTGKQRWRYQARTPTQPQPFLSEKSVYFGSTDGKVSALNASTGKLLWRVALSAEGVPVVQTAEQGVIYVVFVGCYYFGFFGPCPASQPGGPLFALSASTGKTLWEFQGEVNLELDIEGQSMQATQDAFYVTSGLNLFALDPVTGRQLWQFSAGSPARDTQNGYMSIARIINGQVYTVASVLTTSTAAGFKQVLYDLNERSGTRVWNYPSLDTPDLPFFATIENGVAYFSDTTQPNAWMQNSQPAYDEVLALNASDGTPRWHHQQDGMNALNSIVVRNGSVYIAGEDGTLYSLREQDGSLQWQNKLLGNGFHINLEDDENLYVIPYDNLHTRQGVLLALSSTNGSALWTFARESVGSSLSVLKVIQGVLYGTVSSQPDTGTSSFVFALKTTDGSELWSYDAGMTPIVPVLG